MESHGKNQKPPRFKNGPNGCPSTTVYQLFVALFLALGFEFDAPTPEYPCGLLGDAREREGFSRGDFHAGSLGDAVHWLRTLMSNPVDRWTRQVREFLGSPMQHIRRMDKGDRWFNVAPTFYPVFKLWGRKPLKEDIQEALDGSVGPRSVIGNVFDKVPKVLFVELPPEERQWQSQNLELEVYTKDFRWTQMTHKLIATMRGFICDHSGHYTAVVHYGDERNEGWWHVDCLSPTGPQRISCREAIQLFKVNGYVVAFSCEEKQ